MVGGVAAAVVAAVVAVVLAVLSSALLPEAMELTAVSASACNATGGSSLTAIDSLASRSETNGSGPDADAGGGAASWLISWIRARLTKSSHRFSPSSH